MRGAAGCNPPGCRNQHERSARVRLHGGKGMPALANDSAMCSPISDTASARRGNLPKNTSGRRSIHLQNFAEGLATMNWDLK
mmetsp:Transcript_812/g.2917  ORF Transcript_812/g.2917 Transcript_812/m.2917 type:complete len:82 (-) Transcript_812:795-1040(-)